ncbi:competence protein CoiA [Bacillus songklensis]|uniref:Competence protein CoiA n=1 Tax=Bacillus songklensis TaxID=1069116 RepID=A0ABV8B2K3_9BACI
MLIAKNAEGQDVSVLSYPSRQMLRQMRKEETFHCPICKEEVKLKIGNKKIPHFSHLGHTTCEGESKGESDYHLVGKQQLFTTFQNDYKVELEPYLISIRQRPDLLVKTESEEIPIEFQCAAISTEQLCKRTLTYQRAGYKPIWIIGAKRLKRVSYYLYELSPFEWNFLRISPFFAPFLLYYCSFSQYLIQLQHIYPFSSKMAFASVKMIPLQYVNLHHFFPQGIEKSPTLFHAWNQKKKKWRLSYMLYRNRRYEHFLKTLYEKGIPPSHFPSEGGIPHPMLYQIETPACIWQTYVLIDVFSKRTSGNLITWNEIAFSFSKRIKEKEILYRQLPLIPMKDPYAALNEYIERLCDIGMLKRIEEKRYQLLRPYTLPKTTSDAFLEDAQLIEQLKQMK